MITLSKQEYQKLATKNQDIQNFFDRHIRFENIRSDEHCLWSYYVNEEPKSGFTVKQDQVDAAAYELGQRGPIYVYVTTIECNACFDERKFIC